MFFTAIGVAVVGVTGVAALYLVFAICFDRWVHR